MWRLLIGVPMLSLISCQQDLVDPVTNGPYLDGTVVAVHEIVEGSYSFDLENVAWPPPGYSTTKGRLLANELTPIFAESNGDQLETSLNEIEIGDRLRVWSKVAALTDPPHFSADSILILGS